MADHPFPAMPETILAMDRLNSWVRSESARQWTFRPYRAIYFLKREVTEWAHWNLVVHHQCIKVITKCRGCNGTGEYIDSMGMKWPHHRECANTGRARLTFVETRIQNGPTWHTPFLKFYIPNAKAYPDWRLIISETHWQPNQPGKDLSLDEVARDINLLETTFTNRPHDYHTDWGGPFNDFNYSFWIGDTGQVCSFCGKELSADDCHNFGVGRGRVAWTDHCCKQCEKQIGGKTSIFYAFPIPERLITFPIRAWIERNRAFEWKPRRESQAWCL